MQISVVNIEQLGPFYGKHIYIDGVWAARLTSEARIVENIAQRLELNTTGALDATGMVANWLLENYPGCQHPGSIDFDIEAMREPPNTASSATAADGGGLCPDR